ncbi:MAG TPA: 30S ribosomal protein S20 [Elusimicrobia bacterium]|nr:30S ribosomal protein S20 [Elusimicrobiota bacterium]
MKLKTGRHTSALKEARKNLKRRTINKAVKSQIKTAIKKFETALTEKNSEKAKEFLGIVSSILDKAAKKKIIHRKNASRRIGRLSMRLAKIKK